MSEEIQQVPNALLGVDVSHYQAVIDWPCVSEAGVKFAWIKATDGLVADPMLKTNIEGAYGAGIPFGFYHFWRPQHDAKEQADNFMHSIIDATAQTTAASVWPEFAHALDIETGTLPEERQEQALAWLTHIDGTSPKQTKPLVYVSPSYAQINLTDSAWLEYPLWVAHYTENPKPNTDKWPTWMFWQRQGNARIGGISTPVDVDWYNGSAEDFQKLIQLPT